METADALKSRSESPCGPAIAAGRFGGAAAMRWESVRRGEGRRRVWAKAGLGVEHGSEAGGLAWRRKSRAAAAMGGEGEWGSGRLFDSEMGRFYCLRLYILRIYK
jgi:hypothetical protein